MPNLASLLKSEISRLARREIRREVETLKKSSASFRTDIAALKKQVRDLQLELRRTRKTVRAEEPVSELQEEARRFRFRPSGMKAHRQKLGLSAKDYGLLLGASGVSVYNWEEGKSSPRAGALDRIASVRRMGKREALSKLQAL